MFWGDEGKSGAEFTWLEAPETFDFTMCQLARDLHAVAAGQSEGVPLRIRISNTDDCTHRGTHWFTIAYSIQLKDSITEDDVAAMRDAAKRDEHVPSDAEKTEENAVMLAWVHALSFDNPSDYREPAAGGTSGNTSAAAPASAPAPADNAAGQGPFRESEEDDIEQGHIESELPQQFERFGLESDDEIDMQHELEWELEMEIEADLEADFEAEALLEAEEHQY